MFVGELAGHHKLKGIIYPQTELHVQPQRSLGVFCYLKIT